MNNSKADRSQSKKKITNELRLAEDMIASITRL